MGSRLLGIPRQRVRQLLETAEELLLKPQSGYGHSLDRSSPYLRRYTHRQHSGVLPNIVEQFLSDHKERDGTGLAEKEFDTRAIAFLSGRSLHVQDCTIWKQHGGSWGQGPEGKRWLATYTRVTEEAARASNAATAMRYEEEDEAQSAKKNNEKEPSPEDCDEAVEDLSSVKAKHKQSQEAPKTKDAIKKPGDGWMIKVRNVLFGIGPAIQAIAAMSRCDRRRHLIFDHMCLKVRLLQMTL